MALALEPGQGARLLSLDGGGIKGISSLLILEAIMSEVREIEKKNKVDMSDDPRRPVDYFHLAAGTSTGGIIALMLMRLRMSVEDAIIEYNKIGPKVFGTQAKATSGEAKFLPEPLEKAIDDVVGRYDKVTMEQSKNKGPKPDVSETLLVDNKAKMFMCASLRGRGESVLLRSYPMPKYATPVSEEGIMLYSAGAIEKITIKVATRATSAAPTYFPPVRIYETGWIQFWDGGLLNNNPIDQLWRARLDLVGPKASPPKVACVLSLGTSWSSADPPGFLDKWSWLKAAINWIEKIPGVPKLMAKLKPVEETVPFLTNTEAKHLDFHRYINRMRGRENDPEAKTEYFRFNTPTGDVYIDMADHTKMKELSKITKEWLETDEQIDWVWRVAKVLAKTKK